MFVVDPSQGRIIWDDEVKAHFAAQKPFRDWIDEETLSVADLAKSEKNPFEAIDAEVFLTSAWPRHGYHFDDVRRPCAP